jgi:hypothetical protein
MTESGFLSEMAPEARFSACAERDGAALSGERETRVRNLPGGPPDQSSERGDLLVFRGTPLTSRETPLPSGETPLPSRGTPLPSRETPPPSRGTPPPSGETPLPSRGTPPPSRGTPPPSRGTPPPSRGTPPPSGGTPPPSRGTPPPKLGDPSLCWGQPSPMGEASPQRPLALKGHRRKAWRFSARNGDPIFPPSPEGTQEWTWRNPFVPSGLWESGGNADLALKRQALSRCPFGAFPFRGPLASPILGSRDASGRAN